MNIQSVAKLSLAQRVLRDATSPFFARPQLLRMVSRVTRNHAGANASRNHVLGNQARYQIVAQQCVQADLVVRAAKKPPSRRGAFSVSLASSPTKPLTRAVGRLQYHTRSYEQHWTTVWEGFRVDMNKQRISIWAFLIIAVCGACYASMLIGRYNTRKSWEAKTSPLPPRTVVTLCTNFGLSKDHSLCNGKKQPYGPDYYDLIRDTFRPYEEYQTASSEAATYDEVKKTIGMFEYECDAVATTGDGFSFYVCRYDLRGDREFIIGIMYTYPDNAVFRIMTPMGLDGD